MSWPRVSCLILLPFSSAGLLIIRDWISRLSVSYSVCPSVSYSISSPRDSSSSSKAKMSVIVDVNQLFMISPSVSENGLTRISQVQLVSVAKKKKKRTLNDFRVSRLDLEPHVRYENTLTVPQQDDFSRVHVDNTTLIPNENNIVSCLSLLYHQRWSAYETLNPLWTSLPSKHIILSSKWLWPLFFQISAPPAYIHVSLRLVFQCFFDSMCDTRFQLVTYSTAPMWTIVSSMIHLSRLISSIT